MLRQTSTQNSTRAARLGLDEQLHNQIANLQTVAQRLVSGSYQADTEDHEDHTFSGILFPVECRDLLPVEFVEIQSVAVRGDLGNVSVYTYNYDRLKEPEFNGMNSAIWIRQLLEKAPPSEWVRRFGPKNLPPSPDDYVELHFDIPIRLAPKLGTVIYVHSELMSDTAIVYDNQRNSQHSYRNELITVLPGVAHTSYIPFDHTNPFWGGSAWRARREFVGKINYGTKFLLWTPFSHERFPPVFRKAVFTLLCSHHLLSNKPGGHERTLGDIPLDILFRIINFLPHDWFGDTHIVSDYMTDTNRRVNNPHPFPFGHGFHVVWHPQQEMADDEDEDLDEEDSEWVGEEEDDGDEDDDDDPFEDELDDDQFDDLE